MRSSHTCPFAFLCCYWTKETQISPVEQETFNVFVLPVCSDTLLSPKERKLPKVLFLIVRPSFSPYCFMYNIIQCIVLLVKQNL